MYKHKKSLPQFISLLSERIIKLVPELCFMTGLTDAMRADFRIMKELGNYTRLTPPQRQVFISFQKYYCHTFRRYHFFSSLRDASQVKYVLDYFSTRYRKT